MNQFLAIESPLKITKKLFPFDLKSSFRSQDIINFRAYFFEKRLVKKVKINFKIYDVIYLESNNYNTKIVQYLKK